MSSTSSPSVSSGRSIVRMFRSPSSVALFRTFSFGASMSVSRKVSVAFAFMMKSNVVTTAPSSMARFATLSTPNLNILSTNRSEF